MVNTKVFLSNKSQAVRLPKAVAFPSSVSDVSITVVGETRIISPATKTWDVWFDSKEVTDDFAENRMQPKPQQRESFDD